MVAFLRGGGRSEDDAREVTHEFFARLLANGGFAGPDPERGRFRNYLLAAVRYFLRDQLAFTQREKRGGGVPPETLDSSADGAPPLQVADASAKLDAAAFDREWALAVMNRAITALEAQYADDRSEQFAILRPWLVGDDAASYAAAAKQLCMSEGAVKVAVHRLRRRFRELLRGEIEQTLADPADLDDEFRHLCAAADAGM
jgi:RNA polymerase sigma-70 factor (ECF subfamily)